MSSIGTRTPPKWWNTLTQPAELWWYTFTHTPKERLNTLTDPKTWRSVNPYDEWNEKMAVKGSLIVDILNQGSIYVDQDEKAEADAKAKEEADLAAAAAAEAENMKRRKGMRKGMKSTMITPSDQDALGSAPTQKGQLLW